jgi:aromatic ring-cleaving dioxygenase
MALLLNFWHCLWNTNTEKGAHMTVAINGYHAHVYYDPETRETAGIVRDGVAEKFPTAILGRWRDEPVGPHPMPSYQIAFTPELFGEIIPWLATNRDGLTIFVHTETGDDIPDHTSYAMWMGTMETLKLDALR